MNVGTYLTRTSDGVGAVVTERSGGSHDWVTLVLENGRTIYGSANKSGIPSKYTPIDERANVIAHEIVSYRGFDPGTVALAVSASHRGDDEIGAVIDDPVLVSRIVAELAMMPATEEV